MLCLGNPRLIFTTLTLTTETKQLDWLFLYSWSHSNRQIILILKFCWWANLLQCELKCGYLNCRVLQGPSSEFELKQILSVMTVYELQLPSVINFEMCLRASEVDLLSFKMALVPCTSPACFLSSIHSEQLSKSNFI